MQEKHEKFLLIGIDGMDPNIVDKLMEEGVLPNFEKLAGQGTYKRLETILPPASPAVWSSIATGCNPGKTNIFGFIGRTPKNYLPFLSTLSQKQGLTGTKYEPPIKITPFWKYTSEKGIPTTIIRWPLTFPTDEIEGNMLAGLGVPDVMGFLNNYRYYTTEEYDKDEEGANKVVPVEAEDGIIKTVLYGPLKTDRNPRELPIEIKLKKESAVINVQGKEYEIKEKGWSGWIRAKFKIGLMKEATGICKAYVLSIDPFKMYVSSVQLDPEKPMYDFTYPSEYSKKLSDTIGLYHTLGMPEDTKALTEGKITPEIFIEQTEQIEDERDKMFWYEFSKFDSGILAFVYDTSDRITHCFWDEKLLEDDNGELDINPAVKEYYIGKDKFLGKVMEKLEEGTKLLIISDHGFSSFEKGVSINKWLAEQGYLKLTKEPDEKNAGELFEFVDWSKTKAYSVGFSGIYINLKGREGQGIVEASEKDKLIKEIIEKLIDLEDSDAGKKVIHNLYKKEEVYHGPFVELNSPDIVIGFNPGYRMGWQNAIGGVAPSILVKNDKIWDGDHLVDPSFVPGVLFANFKIEKENPSVMDIAPTILSIYGVEAEMDGMSII